MLENQNKDKEFLGSSQRFLLSNNTRINSKLQDNQWGQFDDDWIIPIAEIPEEFRTERKYENYILAKQEEREQKIILKSKPYHFHIEPTNICNLRCPLCSTGVDAKTRKKSNLTFENFKKLIDNIKDVTLLISLQNWGEPTLVQDLPKMIRYAADARIFTRMSTNFSIDYTDEYFEELMKSGLGRLVIDVDGTTQEVYEKYRVKGNLDTVINNTIRAVKLKKENHLKFPIIQLRMLVTKKNEHQIEDFKKLAKKLHADEIELGNIQLDPNTAAEEWLPKNKKYVYNTYLGEQVTTPCHWPWTGFVINSDGGVSSCAIVDDQNADFGNIFENDIMELWNNEYYQSARTTWSKGEKRSKTTICNICKNDTHNKQLLRIGNTFSLTLNKHVSFSKQSKDEKLKIKKL